MKRAPGATPIGSRPESPAGRSGELPGGWQESVAGERSAEPVAAVGRRRPGGKSRIVPPAAVSSSPRLSHLADVARRAARPRPVGRVNAVVGLEVEVEGVSAVVGDGVVLGSPGASIEAEVVALRGPRLLCAPLGSLVGIGHGSPAEALGRPPTLEVGDGLLGRVLDGLGRPMDGHPLPGGLVPVGLDGVPPDPLRRRLVREPLSVGVRAIDTAITIGRGQRIGIMAGSGVGKSTLLGMIVRGTDADIVVVGLVGERNREVGEFVTETLGPEGRARSVVVVATSDRPALVRLRAARVATRIAEHFRDEGRHVLLVLDSLTRLAMAQREVGLAVGEPPASRGYPPSAFALLPALLERAGTGEQGSITGVYTVLVDGDDLDEPVTDAARSILDGHIVLSRRLATSGHYPAIDVLESVSRVASAVTTPAQRALSLELRRLLAAEREVHELVEIGAYVPGTNPVADRALALRGALEAFLCQEVTDLQSAARSWADLEAIVGDGRRREAQDAGRPLPADRPGAGVAGVGP